MLRRTLTCAIAAAVLLVPAGAAVAAPPASALQDALDAVHQGGMPGVFAEVRDGRRTYTPAAGVIDVRSGKPVRDGLRHRVGSITKTFVSSTVLQLSDEGRIDLDAPIGRYLPRLVPGETGARVTVRTLLNHTSGIGDYIAEILKTDDLIEMGRTRYRPEQLVQLGLAAPPTTGFSYSNTNYVLAGLLVEKVTGRSLESEVTRRILRPLKLRDTYFEGADPVIRGPHMHAYVPWPPPDGELRDFTRYSMAWGWAAGDLVSTAADLNTFYRALLTGQVINRRLLAEMQTTVDGFYGLGLYSVPLPCGVFWGHDGGTIGHQTISWHSADGRKQMTYAQSMAFYQGPPTGPQHPIDVARDTFIVTALCGDDQPPAVRSATETIDLRGFMVG